MQIAITGASGFLGSEILQELKKIPDLSIVALTRTEKEEEENVYWRKTDYSVESLTGALKGCCGVIHLAAIRGTTGRIADYQENEVMTEKLLIAMKEAKVKRIVFASSIAVYSDTDAIPWSEQTPLSPKTLYGITKASCEYLCRYYSKQYDYSYTIFRIAQVLGTGEKRKGMMNVFLDTAREKGQIRVTGKSIARRQYIYVKDLARAFVWAVLQKEEKSDIFALGMPDPYSNLEIAQKVNQVFENDTPIFYDDTLPEVIEPSCMDVRKLTRYCGIRIRDMEEALEDIRKDM